jgi:hypothetical protein
MSITHEQARQLIQLNMDHMLNPQEAAILSAHLRDCDECQGYANEIQEAENILLPIMKRQWNAQPVPLSVATLTRKSVATRTSILLAIRTAAFSLVFMAIFFSAWQFWISGPSGSSRMPQSIPPVPTPAALTAQSPVVRLTVEGCALLPYLVQEQDTIAGIAGQFSVSDALLLEINQIEANAVHPGMELLIPLCDFTPTGTSHAATFTTTHTPILYLTTSTPGG